MSDDPARVILADVFGERHETHFEHRLLEILERLADAVEAIAHPYQPPSLTGVTLMALPTGPVAPGATDTFTATAVDQNGAVDANATISVASDNEAVFSVTGSSDAGVFSGTWTAVADGTANVTATGTDGTTTVDTGADNPAAITVATPVVLTAVNLA